MSDVTATVIPVEVRFRDLDAYGHVNNSVFLTYLEQARIKILGDYFSLDGDGAETAFVMKRVECEFKRPINLRETIYVRMWVHEKRRASFTISYELIDGDGRVYATAATVLVAIDAGSGRPAAIPDWFDEAVEQGAARYGETPDKG